MNYGIDLFIVIVLILTCVSGFFSGFLKNIFVWGGMILGIVLAPFITPSITEALADTATSRFTVNTVLLSLLMLAGGVAGGILGSIVRFVLPFPLKFADRIMGAVLGFVLVGLLAWFILPLLKTVGDEAEQWRAESVVAEIVDGLPHPPIGRIEDAIKDARAKSLEVQAILDASQLQ